MDPSESFRTPDLVLLRWRLHLGWVLSLLKVLKLLLELLVKLSLGVGGVMLIETWKVLMPGF